MGSEGLQMFMELDVNTLPSEDPPLLCCSSQHQTASFKFAVATRVEEI